MPIDAVTGLGSPMGLYSHATWAPTSSRLLAVSGQLSVDAVGTTVAEGDFAGQLTQVFANLAGVLAAAGGTLEDVLKMTTYLVSDDLIGPFYEVRARLFAELFPSGTYPGNTLLVVSRLVKPEFLVEIEALAAIG